MYCQRHYNTIEAKLPSTLKESCYVEANLAQQRINLTNRGKKTCLGVKSLCSIQATELLNPCITERCESVRAPPDSLSALLRRRCTRQKLYSISPSLYESILSWTYFLLNR
jgi:hypothetical protein